MSIGDVAIFCILQISVVRLRPGLAAAPAARTISSRTSWSNGLPEVHCTCPHRLHPYFVPPCAVIKMAGNLAFPESETLCYRAGSSKWRPRSLNDGSRTRVTYLIEAFASGRFGCHPKPFDALFTIRYVARVRVASSKGATRQPGHALLWRRVCFVVPAISKSYRRNRQ